MWAGRGPAYPPVGGRRRVQTRASSDAYTGTVTRLHRITRDPDVMGGRPCIRGLRVTVGTIVGLLAAGHDPDEVLDAYPYLERDDIRQALAYAAWRTEEQEVAVRSS